MEKGFGENRKSTSFKGTAGSGKKIFDAQKDESAEMEPELAPEADQEVDGNTETVEPLWYDSVENEEWGDELWFGNYTLGRLAGTWEIKLIKWTKRIKRINRAKRIKWVKRTKRIKRIKRTKRIKRIRRISG